MSKVQTIKKQVHIMIQGKGGCGKSFCFLSLSMYFKFFKKMKTQIFDIDQVNTTLTQYKGLQAEHIKITDKNNINEIDQRLLYGLVQRIIESDSDVVIIDTGSNTFLNLLDYLIQNQIFDLFYSMNITPIVHTVIVGSGDYNDTLHGAKTIIENLSVPVIVWVNEYYGEVIEKLKNSELNEESYIHSKTISSFVLLNKLNSKLQAKDMEIFNTQRITVADIDKCDELSLVAKLRVKRVFNEIFEQLECVSIINQSEE